MICQKCGREAPTKYVAFYQNIGMLFMRMMYASEGNFCKPCIHSTFWSYFAVNLTLGWWGIISLIINPFLILNNVIRYVLCLGMPSPDPLAGPPELTDAALDRLRPHTGSIIDRLNAGEPLEKVADDVAMISGATPGQVALYVHALVQAAQRQKAGQGGY